MNVKIYDYFDKLDNYFMVIMSLLNACLGLSQLWFLKINSMEFFIVSILTLISINFMIMYRRKIS